MWIVRLALTRPYTFVALALLICILGGAAIVSMPVDIFPYVDIPVISAVWSYNGITPEEMEKRIVTVFERALTTTVNDIEHIESQSYPGVSVTRIYFQPNAKIDLAIAQVTAISQTLLRIMPPGIFPPNVLKYDASSVPILQLGLSSKTLSEQDLFDLGLNFIRTQLATVQGASISLPFGGKYRQIMVDLDPGALYARQVSPLDVSNALNQQNLILPSGSVKIDRREYLVRLNSSPPVVEQMNNLPIRTVNGATVYLKDIGNVRDGYSVQQNVVRTNGSRGALLTVLRNGQASTLDVVQGVKAALPKVVAGLPPALEVKQLFDQSIFVKASIEGVLKEGILAAALTGLMILLFLGSWRSTVIVSVSIPLSILSSLSVLKLFGETINVMTLGGLALAVGILVDDATVTIENIHRNLAMGKSLTRALLDGAMQIAAPTFISTLSICIVFVPVLLLTGSARFLFTPLAMAVVFAMLASYLLSRTLVPTMVHYMLRSEAEMYQQGHSGHAAGGSGVIWTVHRQFNRGFERLQSFYTGLLDFALDHRITVMLLFLVFVAGSLALSPLVGRDFFPAVDSGQLRLHARAPSGTRIEQTEVIFAAIEDEIRHVIPPAELDSIVDNIGLPLGGVNLAYGDAPTIGSADGEILISLNKEQHGPADEYTQRIRQRLNQRFPDVVFFFEAANITSQILNFGLPAPIDVQIVSRNPQLGYSTAAKLAARLSRIPGAVDVHVHQTNDNPEIRINVDRTKAGQLGLTQRDVTSNLLISLSSSGQIAPNQWLNLANGVNYNVAVQTPQYRMENLDDVLRTPISAVFGVVNSTTPDSLAGAATAGASSTAAGPAKNTLAFGNPGAQPDRTQLLANMATVSRGQSAGIINHFNVQPVYDVFVNTDRRDLGRVGDAVMSVVDDTARTLPKAMSINVRGQYKTMQDSFFRLGVGMIGAVALVYLLMVVNFQSWLDPFIILMALPGAFAGIVWSLFLTQTTFSVPSLMGAIMCTGVATANSILMVVFANDEQIAGKNPRDAALSAGWNRLRPVLMTALAMIIGMLPMSLGLGEGGEQNAPLGRAVIGGLLVATFTTLLVVPVIYSYLRRKAPLDYDKEIFLEEHQGELPPDADFA
ncbi:MAG: efflux RND transporter permease subunit [Acidobacteria bacterium]|nr:efflux RND transporter permease subunit [Acidobacteriota bacterium]